MQTHDVSSPHEPSSLGSHTRYGRSSMAFISFFLAAMLVTLGVTGSAVTGSVAAAPMALAPTEVASRVPIGMPTGMKIRLLLSVKNENVRQVRLNLMAKKKHNVRILRNKIVKTARAQIGDPYRAGYAGPNAFDCSGFTRYVYQQATGRSLPHYSRAQYAQVRKIKKKNAQPGDLVFFFRNGAHHVGIFIGNGKMIDSPRRGEQVRVSPITGSWWSRSYTGMGRILPA